MRESGCDIERMGEEDGESRLMGRLRGFVLVEREGVWVRGRVASLGVGELRHS